LTPLHKERRLQWCLTFADRDDLFWNNVVFSDESAFNVQSGNQQYVRRPFGKRYESEYIIHKRNRSVGNISVWGCFSMNGFSELILLNGHLNSAKYLTILQDHFLPILDNLLPESGVFQQDNCPIHRSRVVTQWLINNNVNTLNWPAISADLNPIENVWGLLKNKLHHPNIINSQDLFNVVRNLWNTELAKVEYRSNLINSMRRRIMEVINRNGSHCSY
jgi:transposase